MPEYDPPVSALLKLGRPDLDIEETDYAAHGITSAHVPDMLRLLADDELITDDSDELGDDSDPPEGYAHIHAWRALGQLRAPEAIDPLLNLLAEQESGDWSDWVTEEVPSVLGQYGPGIIPTVVARLDQRGQKEHEPCYLANALVEVARRHPEARTEVINQLCRVLDTAEVNNPSFNGFIISDLMDLNAQEAWPAIETAFATGNVDETIAGDAPDVKFHLGLGPKPPPRRYDTLGTIQRGWRPPVQSGSNAKQRFNERQRKKKAEKKKNKKKRK